MSGEEKENFYLIQAGTEYKDYEKYEMGYLDGIIRLENYLYKYISEDCSTSEVIQLLETADNKAFYWCLRLQQMLIKGNGLAVPNIGSTAVYAENLFLKYRIPYPENWIEIVTNQFNMQKEVRYDTDKQIEKKHAEFIFLLERNVAQRQIDPSFEGHLKSMAKFLKEYRTNFCRYKNGTYSSSEKTVKI